MINRHSYIIIFIVSLLSVNAYSQTDCITDPPLAPVLTSVSVQPETGNTIFTWTPSTSPGIAAYILYSYKNGDGMAIDTVRDPAATSYTLSSTSTKYFSVSYVIAAMRLPRCTSIFSNVINSIFASAAIDTCMGRIAVSWNSYPSLPEKVIGYSVLSSVGGSNYGETGTVSAADTSFTLNEFTIDAEYCFVVRANLSNGQSSTSNKSCLSTRMQRPPDWINADQATINSDGKIALSFTIDPLSEISHFSLERKTLPNGSYQVISQPVSVNGSVKYTDLQAETNVINYYRLSAMNSCSLPIIVSNLASNIVLSSERSGDNITLSWNPYRNWLGTIMSYKLFVNTGKGFEEYAGVLSSDTVFMLSYRQIMYDISRNEVCFYVSATETSNPHGIAGESRSSPTCLTPTENITVPNVFTPNNDLKNDRFKPVLSFTPAEYNFIISNRQGKVLFETRDYLEEWDGSLNGDPQPQGVYLWFLKVTTPTGKNISRTGTVTIISK